MQGAVLEAGEVALARQVLPQEERGRFGERPLEMRIANLVARAARAFAGGLLGALHQGAMKVRLTVDLTKYHPELLAGAEGNTVGAHGMWSRGSDRFVGVSFPGIGTFDILWESLQIVDPEALQALELREKEKSEALKHATNVVRVFGPQGGFRCVSYEYVDSRRIRVHVSNADREEAKLLIKFFSDNGVAVTDETINASPPAGQGRKKRETHGQNP